MSYVTKSWVLDEFNNPSISIEEVEFSELSSQEVLVKPLYGCFEGNMLHAIERTPINICRERKERKVILGNAGVVEVQDISSDVMNIKNGQKCLFFCNGTPDAYGFPVRIAGYDCPGSMGLLSKLTKVNEKQLIPLPDDSSISLQQWAAFSLRYITAWSNWKVAYACFLSQMDGIKSDEINVVAWGGGVSLAELTLANHYGCKTFMTTSNQERSKLIEDLGIVPINRSTFDKKYFENEFISYLDKITNHKRASIFVDNIGGNLFNLTLKSLARQGVLATSGWKNGAVLPFVRSIECINRHIFVHTHYAKYSEGVEAVNFAVKNRWLPEVDNTHYTWDEIPQMVDDYRNGKITSYFPIYSIN